MPQVMLSSQEMTERIKMPLSLDYDENQYQ